MNKFVEPKEAVVVFRDESINRWRLVVGGILLEITFATQAEALAHKRNINDTEQPLT